MNRGMRFALPALALLTSFAAGTARAQFYKSAADRLHVGTLDLGASGQFSTLLTQNPNGGTAFYTVGSNTALNPTAVSNQQQYTTDSTGLLVSVGLQPVNFTPYRGPASP